MLRLLPYFPLYLSQCLASRKLVYSTGRFGLERSFPEKPALIKAFLRAGIKNKVIIRPAREKPTDACNGCPSLLKISAPETTRPARVNAGTNIDGEEDIGVLSGFTVNVLSSS